MALFDNININKLKSGLSKTRNKIVNSINEKITGKAVIDENIIDEIEEILITSDIGFDTAEKIIENLRVAIKSEKDRTQFNIINTVKDELISVLSNGSADDKSKEDDITKISKPYVILIVGVNGVGWRRIRTGNRPIGLLGANLYPGYPRPSRRKTSLCGLCVYPGQRKCSKTDSASSF